MRTSTTSPSPGRATSSAPSSRWRPGPQQPRHAVGETTRLRRDEPPHDAARGDAGHHDVGRRMRHRDEDQHREDGLRHRRSGSTDAPSARWDRHTTIAARPQISHVPRCGRRRAPDDVAGRRGHPAVCCFHAPTSSGQTARRHGRARRRRAKPVAPGLGLLGRREAHRQRRRQHAGVDRASIGAAARERLEPAGDVGAVRRPEPGLREEQRQAGADADVAARAPVNAPSTTRRQSSSTSGGSASTALRS